MEKKEEFEEWGVLKEEKINPERRKFLDELKQEFKSSLSKGYLWKNEKGQLCWGGKDRAEKFKNKNFTY